MNRILELQQVTRIYSDGAPVTALYDASFVLNRGETVVVLGASGSGKSTMLGLLGLLDRPTHGRVLVNGRDVHDVNDAERSRLRAESIGFVFQQFNLIGHLTALENVETALLFRGIGAGERRRRARASLQRLGIDHRSTHRPGQMSGGEQQRVAIARAVVGRPGVIIADEPTGNLDSATGARVIELLAGITKDGVATVLATHDPSLSAIATRVINLRDGRLDPGA